MTKAAATILTLVLVAGCVSRQPPLSRVAQEVQRRGYHLKESSVVLPTSWESSTFRMRSKRWFSFRADQPLVNSSDTYCRFKLIEESYDSAVDAQYRVDNIRLADPGGGAEEQYYLHGLRAGFRAGNVAYVLQTDAIQFWDEVQRLTNELALDQ
jgi:hypothetical protein